MLCLRSASKLQFASEREGRCTDLRAASPFVLVKIALLPAKGSYLQTVESGPDLEQTLLRRARLIRVSVPVSRFHLALLRWLPGFHPHLSQLPEGPSPLLLAAHWISPLIQTCRRKRPSWRRPALVCLSLALSGCNQLALLPQLLVAQESSLRGPRPPKE